MRSSILRCGTLIGKACEKFTKSIIQGCIPNSP
jgi:hypothetical protein